MYDNYGYKITVIASTQTHLELPFFGTRITLFYFCISAHQRLVQIHITPNTQHRKLFFPEMPHFQCIFEKKLSYYY